MVDFREIQFCDDHGHCICGNDCMAPTMEDVLIQHQRQNSSTCLCGWSQLGQSHPGHQAAMLKAAGYGRI